MSQPIEASPLRQNVPPMATTSTAAPTSALEAVNVDVPNAAMAAILYQIKEEFAKIHRRPEINASVLINPELELSDSDESVDERVAAPRIFSRTKVDPKAEPACPVQIQKPVMQLQFDRVTPSTFDGDHTKWIAFCDEFLEYVHNNDQVATIMKFRQLKTHLSGIALEAISDFSMCTTDYEAAWSLLLERYNNEHLIVMQ